MKASIQGLRASLSFINILSQQNGMTSRFCRRQLSGNDVQARLIPVHASDQPSLETPVNSLLTIGFILIILLGIHLHHCVNYRLSYSDELCEREALRIRCIESEMLGYLVSDSFSVGTVFFRYSRTKICNYVFYLTCD